MIQYQYIFQLAASGGYFIVTMFLTYTVVAIFRPHAIARMWAFKLGLVLFGLALALPLISSLVMVSTQLNGYGRPSAMGGSLIQIMLPCAGLLFSVSIIATLGSLLPRLVFIAPKDDRPPRNPFE